MKGQPASLGRDVQRQIQAGRDVQRQIQAGRDQKYWEVGDRGRKEKAKGMCGGGM